MNIKKIIVKQDEVLVRRTTHTIETDFDFTQVYDWFYTMCFNIKSPRTFQLLFFMLKDMKEDNIIYTSLDRYQAFDKECKKYSNGVGITERTFFSCIAELEHNKIIKKIGRGRYLANYHIIYKDDKQKRLELIKDTSSASIFNPIKSIDYFK